MRVMSIFCLYGSLGASSNYRILQYCNDLEEKLIIKPFVFWPDVYNEKLIYDKEKYKFVVFIMYVYSVLKRLFQIVFIANETDIIFIQKCLFPKIKFMHKVLFMNKDKKIIYDVDDAVYLDNASDSNSIAQKADLVIVGNHQLALYYSQLNEKIVLIPTADMTEKYRKHIISTFDKKVIGWIGSKSTIENLELVIEPLNEIIERHPEVEFHYVCDKDYGFSKLISNAYFIRWQPDEYISDMANFSIGIMPLNYNEFNASKCGFKLIQYMNLEKPVIATDLGENGKIVGMCGFIVKNDDEAWINALENLLYNEQTYKRCVANIQCSFFDVYSYKTVLHKLMNAIESVN